MIDSLDSQSVSQLEGGLYGLVVAVVNIAAVGIDRSLNSHNLEPMGVGTVNFPEIALRPEDAHATVVERGNFN